MSEQSSSQWLSGLSEATLSFVFLVQAAGLNELDPSHAPDSSSVSLSQLKAQLEPNKMFDRRTHRISRIDEEKEGKIEDK